MKVKEAVMNEYKNCCRNEGEDWEENDAIQDSYCMGEMSSCYQDESVNQEVFLFSMKPLNYVLHLPWG